MAGRMTRKGKIKGGILLAAVILVAGAVWLSRTRPLGEALELDVLELPVEATLIRSVPEKQEDGSTLWRTEILELPREEKEGGAALLAAMEGIPCRWRFRLPFETVTVYQTGRDSLSISFSAGGRQVELSMLSGSSALYDTGIGNRQFQVGADAFESLAGIVEEYGVPRGE